MASIVNTVEAEDGAMIILVEWVGSARRANLGAAGSDSWLCTGVRSISVSQAYASDPHAPLFENWH